MNIERKSFTKPLSGNLKLNNTKPIKIALIGNVCNNMYNMGIAMKRYTNIQPHLYLDDHMDIHTTPELNDPLAKFEKDWVFYDKKWDPTSFYKKGDKTFINKLLSEKYDAIIVSSAGVWLAPFMKDIKVFHWTTGGDITKMPFPSRFAFSYKGLFAKLKMQYIGFIHRRALKYVDHFLSHPYKPNYQALKKLKVPDKKIAKVYFPIIIDTSIFKYNQDFKKDISEENFNKMKNFTFKIFHPSRLMIQRKKALIEAGQWKGNEMLLLGLRRFIDDYAVNDICIVLPDRVQSVDKEIFERIIKEQRLENNIVWVKGETDQGFNKREMVAFYSSSDLVVDEFGIGWFGSIVIEGAACSRPTMCYVDENATHKMYPWHPIISVNTPIDIAKEIARLYFDKDYSNKKGEESRSWAVEFHSQENAGIKYAAQIQSLLEESLS